MIAPGTLEDFILKAPIKVGVEFVSFEAFVALSGLTPKGVATEIAEHILRELEAQEGHD